MARRAPGIRQHGVGARLPWCALAVLLAPLLCGGGWAGREPGGGRVANQLGSRLGNGPWGNLTWQQRAEGEALLAFKRANVDPTGVLRNWALAPAAGTGSPAPAPPWCAWTGITCNAWRRVVAVTLDQRSLQCSGQGQSIPPEWGNLTGLRRVSLHGNLGLCGSLPDAIGSWTKAKVIDLSGNSFSGALPQNLSRLTNLVSIDLSSNAFDGTWPTVLAHCSNLTSLQLRYNNFSGELRLFDGQWPRLAAIDLSYNNFTGSLPHVFGQWTQLRSLAVAFNTFNGTLPASLSNLRVLTSLDLSQNQFVGPFPIALLNAGIAELNLSFNQFDGELPLAVSRLTTLSRLSLNRNNFSGILPAEIGQLTRLQQLDVSHNNFTGRIPTEFSALRGLVTLVLEHNHFHGSILPMVAGFPNLQYLIINVNNFSESVPAALSGLTQLKDFEIKQNMFYGELPDSFIDAAYIEVIDLAVNRFQGRLPTSLSSLGGLQLFNASHNSFNGIVPVEGCPQLDLSFNAFRWSTRGQSPDVNKIADICKNGFLSLAISGNSLEGPLPTCLRELRFLSKLELAALNLSANIDSLSQLSALSWLQSLDLSNNRLQGTFPNAILRMASLTRLDLSGNPINRDLPDSLSRMLSLRSLNLDQTQLSGSLPSSLGVLPLSTLHVPGIVLCPKKCTSLNVNAWAAFCDRCAAYCAECPALPDTLDVEVLLAYQRRSDRNKLRGMFFGANGTVQMLRLDGPAMWQLSRDPLWDPLDLKLLAPLNQTLKNLTLIPGLGIPSQGTLPRSISLLTALEVVVLRNLVKGTVPTALEALRALTLLDLSGGASGADSGLSGDIGFVQRLRSLRSLNLALNAFTGTIPNSFSFPRGLASLDLSSNFFEGLLPESLTNLTDLTLLDVSGNNFQGHLPPGLASLPLAYLFYAQGSPEALTCPPAWQRPPRSVLPRSAFCQQCPQYCRQYYPPPPPPSPPRPPPPPLQPPPLPPSQNSGLPAWLIGVIAVIGVVIAASAAAVAYLVWRSWQGSFEDDVEKRGVRRLTYKELAVATSAFSRLIATGTTSKVFEGISPSGQRVAVKRQKMTTKQDAAEARARIGLLSSAHHRHLIALLGYCLHKKRLYLVYEFAERGTLSHVLRTDPASLTWQVRLEIAAGAALGLDYLHTQLQPPIVHGDVRSSKILVTEDFEAKVGEFGNFQREGHKETVRAPGSVAHMDPACLASGRVTAASDVFGIGVILAELATGWPTVENGEHILDRIVKETSEGSVEGIIAESLQPEVRRSPRTEDDYSPSAWETGDAPTVECFGKFVGLAMRCCSSEPARRPAMRQVALELEDMLANVMGESVDKTQPKEDEGEMPFPWYKEPRIINSVEDMFGSLLRTSGEFRAPGSARRATEGSRRRVTFIMETQSSDTTGTQSIEE